MLDMKSIKFLPKEDWNEAEKFADQLISTEDSKALGYYIKAGISLQLDEQPKALLNLNESINANPSAVESLTAKAKVLSELQGVESAIQDISKHCEQYPEQAHCRYILGSLYAQDKQFDQAEKALNATLEINEKLVPAYRQLAKVHAAQSDVDAVEASLKRGIDALDNNKLRFELAAVYYGLGRHSQAAEAYEAILAKNENSLAAKNNLAMIYAENIGTEDSLKTARSMIVDLQESENPAYLDTVGWVMYLNGEYEQSINYLKAAVDKLGSSALLQYHLGMAYYKNDQKELAKEHLTLATAEEAKYPGFEEAVETLKSL
jgi:tetratricopeptide (TPR) repeat protein